MIGVASFFPFMSVVSNAEIIFSNQYLNALYTLFKFSNVDDFLKFLGICTLIVVFTTICVRSLTAFYNMKFSQTFAAELSSRLFNVSLTQNYKWHLSQNPDEIGKAILSETDEVVNRGLMPFIQDGKLTCCLINFPSSLFVFSRAKLDSSVILPMLKASRNFLLSMLRSRGRTALLRTR